MGNAMTTTNANYGIDFDNVTFTTAAFNSNGFVVNPSGVVTGASYKVGSNQVVSARATGYTPMTGSPDGATPFDTSTVTLVQLAERVMALQASLTAHGLIGP